MTSCVVVPGSLAERQRFSVLIVMRIPLEHRQCLCGCKVKCDDCRAQQPTPSLSPSDLVKQKLYMRVTIESTAWRGVQGYGCVAAMARMIGFLFSGFKSSSRYAPFLMRCILFAQKELLLHDRLSDWGDRVSLACGQSALHIERVRACWGVLVAWYRRRWAHVRVIG